MSNGFANSTTRGMGKFEREVESRMKRLDVFTDDFSPPGTAEVTPGQNTQKTNNNYQDKHTDEAHPDLKNPVRMAQVGNPKVQQEMDNLDREQDAYEKPIKKSKDAFPGSPTNSHRLEADKRVFYKGEYFQIRKGIVGTIVIMADNTRLGPFDNSASAEIEAKSEIEEKLKEANKNLSAGKDPKSMSNSEIKNEYNKLREKSSKHADEMIKAGFGNIRPSDMRANPNKHPLFKKGLEIMDRMGDLRSEAEARYGPGLSSVDQLPKR